MAYRAKIAASAERDLALIFVAINAGESRAAREWHLGPGVLRTPRPEALPGNAETQRSVTSLYGNKPHVYRAIFRVNDARKIVEVLHVRHGARAPFKPGEI